uniref:Putative secreted protein n=1 Tax=Anopheles marajoara TaxID=58244 RepID=A0A2M4CF45_9DIPT
MRRLELVVFFSMKRWMMSAKAAAAAATAAWKCFGALDHGKKKAPPPSTHTHTDTPKIRAASLKLPYSR